MRTLTQGWQCTPTSCPHPTVLCLDRGLVRREVGRCLHDVPVEDTYQRSWVRCVTGALARSCMLPCPPHQLRTKLDVTPLQACVCCTQCQCFRIVLPRRDRHRCT